MFIEMLTITPIYRNNLNMYFSILYNNTDGIFRSQQNMKHSVKWYWFSASFSSYPYLLYYFIEIHTQTFQDWLCKIVIYSLSNLFTNREHQHRINDIRKVNKEKIIEKFRMTCSVCVLPAEDVETNQHFNKSSHLTQSQLKTQLNNQKTDNNDNCITTRLLLFST